MYSAFFWDIIPCSPLKVSRRFRGHTASIFKVEEEAEQEIGVKAGGKQGSETSVDFLLYIWIPWCECNCMQTLFNRLLTLFYGYTYCNDCVTGTLPSLFQTIAVNMLIAHYLETTCPLAWMTAISQGQCTQQESTKM
jgi:hypothetical protein